MTEIWHTEPPHGGVTYRVTEDEWNDDRSQRIIHSVEIIETQAWWTQCATLSTGHATSG